MRQQKRIALNIGRDGRDHGCSRREPKAARSSNGRKKGRRKAKVLGAETDVP